MQCCKCRLLNRTAPQSTRPPQTNVQFLPLEQTRSIDERYENYECNEPFPSFVLATPLPRMRSHIRRARSFRTLNATFPDGCTAIELMRPLWPLRTRRTAQSRARNKHRVPSSDADNR